MTDTAPDVTTPVAQLYALTSGIDNAAQIAVRTNTSRQIRMRLTAQPADD